MPLPPGHGAAATARCYLGLQATSHTRACRVWSLGKACRAGRRFRASWRGRSRTAMLGFEFVFYGDSITERWRGTEMDNPRDDGPACIQSFRRSFGKYRTALLAISGDQTGHLLWRLMHGEVPRRPQPAAAILLIGTNDLGLARRQRNDPTDAAPEAVRRLTATVALLRERLPSTHVVVAAVLPRGWAGPTDFSWPNKFTQGVDFINEHMATAAASTANMTFLDCNDGFMTNGKINSKLMPDALHPNPAGLDVLARCYTEVLLELGLLKQRRRHRAYLKH